jgi:hypothetical protein
MLVLIRVNGEEKLSPEPFRGCTTYQYERAPWCALSNGNYSSLAHFVLKIQHGSTHSLEIFLANRKNAPARIRLLSVFS